jgi:hypothetical protein
MDLDTRSCRLRRSGLDALSDRIVAAIRRMGVDPNALLPRSRVEEAADAFTERDPDRARQIVRRVAPAAVRSVSRRVLSDPELRVRRGTLCPRLSGADLAEPRGERRRATGVFRRWLTDAGRAFMLLDAADRRSGLIPSSPDR